MPVQRTFPVVPDVSRSVQDEFRTLRKMLYDTQDALEAAAKSAKQGAAGTLGPRGAAGAPGAAGASTGPVGPSTINLTQFLGLLSQAQRAFIPQFASLPGLQDPASQDGDL